MKLNVNKSCGPDVIHPQILIELVALVSKPLALLLIKPWIKDVYRKTGKWRTFQQYLRKELKIKQRTIDP